MNIYAPPPKQSQHFYSTWNARFSPNVWVGENWRAYVSHSANLRRVDRLLGSVISNPASSVDNPGTIQEEHFHNRSTLAPCFNSFRRSRNCGRCSHLQIWWGWSGQSRNQEHFHIPSSPQVANMLHCNRQNIHMLMDPWKAVDLFAPTGALIVIVCY